MTFRFIAAKRAEHSIAIMCRVLEVSRSGYPRLGPQRPLSARAVEGCAADGADPRVVFRCAVARTARRGSGPISPSATAERISPQAGRAADAPSPASRPARRGEVARQHHDPAWPACASPTISSNRTFSAAAPKPGLGRGQSPTCAHGRGWALYLVAVQDLYSPPASSAGQWPDHMRARARHGRARDGPRPPPPPTPGPDLALRPRAAKFVSLSFGQKARAAGIAQVDGQQGRLLRQRRRRELLRDTQERN